MMTHVPFTSRDKFGRYYTNNRISNFLISFMDTASANNILDLGSGPGSLSLAAAKRWLNATIFSLDIAIKPENLIFNKKAKRHHFIGNALHYNLPKTIGLKEGSIDVAICNPPYIKPDWNDDYQRVAECIGISRYLSIAKIYFSEVLFLAQIIRMLKNGGEAGVILPDGIFSAQKFCSFREFLIKEHYVKKIIQLPRRIFKRTEAKTHILIFNKENLVNSPNSLIELRSINEMGNISSPIYISGSQGIERLDYSYHKKEKNISYNLAGFLPISAMATVKRGKLSSKEIKQLKQTSIHTTDIKGFCSKLKLNGKKNMLSYKNKKFVIARPGDILISRVGRNFYKKIALVQSGYAVISDCIFVISSTNENIIKIFDFLTSQTGQQILNDLSYGVAATQISMNQLYNIRIGI